MLSIDKCNVVFSANTPLETHAMHDISMNINEGEFVSVIGSNGAGKSTFLNMIAGEVSLTSGSISINGVSIEKRSVHQRADVISRVFQNPLLGSCADLSIEENMALAYGRGSRPGLRLALTKDKQALFKEKLALLNLGLENRLEDKVGQLSGGQRQALSLLMATLRPLELLLLDEHTSALDPKASKMILRLTQKFIDEQKITSVMVTHSMQQALKYGNRLLMFHEGKVLRDISAVEKSKLTTADLLQMFELYS